MPALEPECMIESERKNSLAVASRKIARLGLIVWKTAGLVFVGFWNWNQMSPKPPCLLKPRVERARPIKPLVTLRSQSIPPLNLERLSCAKVARLKKGGSSWGRLCMDRQYKKKLKTWFGKLMVLVKGSKQSAKLYNISKHRLKPTNQNQ